MHCRAFLPAGNALQGIPTAGLGCSPPADSVSHRRAACNEACRRKQLTWCKHITPSGLCRRRAPGSAEYDRLQLTWYRRPAGSVYLRHARCQQEACCRVRLTWQRLPPPCAMHTLGGGNSAGVAARGGGSSAHGAASRGVGVRATEPPRCPNSEQTDVQGVPALPADARDTSFFDLEVTLFVPFVPLTSASASNPDFVGG